MRILVHFIWNDNDPTLFFSFCNLFLCFSFTGIISSIAVHLYSLKFCLQLGMGSALETLCGQAYGAGKMSMLGIYLQRSWVILLATAVLLSVTYIFATPILKLLGQSHEIAELAGRFSIWMIPELFAYAVNFPIQKFLQAQSKVMAMAWISAAVLVIHVILSWLFIIKLEMGLVGAAITLNFAWFLLDVGQLVYVLSASCKDSWTGFSWLAFTELVDFLGLSLASAVMLWSVLFPWNFISEDLQILLHLWSMFTWSGVCFHFHVAEI